MRIAMLSYHTCPLATLGGKDTGGMNVYVRELTRQFGRLGVHVDVFTRSQDEHVPHVLHDLGYGNRVVHIPAGPEVPLPKEELASHISTFADQILAFTEGKGLEYDLIHSHYWMSGLAAIRLREAWDAPFVQMFHTLGHMKNRIAGPGEAEGEYRIEGELKVMQSADRIIASTSAELAQLRWLYGADTRKISVVPPGVDTSHFYPIPKDEARAYVGIPKEDRNILFVGRVEPLKGIDLLLRAIAMMAGYEIVNRGALSVMIVGGDPNVNREDMSAEMTRLQDLRKEYGIGDVVTFLGKRGQDTLPYYYSAADVVVMPSQYESFGMVALEAMACGTPVVASEVGGLAFLVRESETGFLIRGDNPDELCDRLIALITNETLRETMGRRATEVAREYSWQIVGDKVLEVYRSVLRAAAPV
ncbi:MAG TPA: glycosyltransferase [Anaerolineales bacterium]|nr:glycosyltransferase [Anaerolineales bacterium]